MIMLRKLFAAGIGATGLIITLQGLGIYTPMPSLMYQDERWAVVGIAMVVVSYLIWPKKPK
jgi:hypothetical protein